MCVCGGGRDVVGGRAGEEGAGQGDGLGAGGDAADHRLHGGAPVRGRLCLTSYGLCLTGFVLTGSGLELTGSGL